MNRGRRWWWALFALSSIALLAGIGWATRELLRLEQVEVRTKAELEYEGGVRLALWRMESWFTPLLGQETTRPYFQYLSYYPQERAYDSMFREIAANEVQTPSPLLTFDSPLFLLHFQVDAAGRVTSPQVPMGNALDLALATGLTAERLDRHRATLARLEVLLGAEQVIGLIAASADHQVEQMLCEADTEVAVNSEAGPALQQRWSPTDQSKLERSKRAQTYVEQSQNVAWVANAPAFDGDDIFSNVTVGPFVPVWVDDLAEACSFDPDIDDDCVLLLVRRVRTATESRVQGVVVNWTVLRDSLHEQIVDLFPDAELQVLRNAEEADANAGRALAQLPLAIVVPPVAVTMPDGLTSMRGTLLLVWIAAAVAVLAVGLMLRASFAYGEKRARFASAVTHELRTPLTTFRMYSEMLANGMVRSEEQSQQYLSTLKTESDRLAALVENVLAYARLERGRTEVHPQTVAVAELLADSIPALERRAEAAGMTVTSTPNGTAETTVKTDVDVVRQILLNLVDNACKYASGGDDRVIQITGELRDDAVEISVRDHGPGIATNAVRGVFNPFDRGNREPGDTTPGLGLGLALARGLARRLGGDLRLDPTVGTGACFRLTIPRG